MVSMDSHLEDLKKILSSHLPIHTFCLILSELPLVDPYPLVYEPKLSSYKDSFWSEV